MLSWASSFDDVITGRHALCLSPASCALLSATKNAESSYEVRVVNTNIRLVLHGQGTQLVLVIVAHVVELVRSDAFQEASSQSVSYGCLHS